MKIYVYGQQCVMAGEQVTQSDIDQYGDDEPDEWVCHEGSPEELEAEARADLARAHASRHTVRSARTVLEAVWWETAGERGERVN